MAEQNHTEHQDGPEGRRADDRERIRPGDVDSLLASSADLVETDRRDRANQREAGREGKHQRQQVIAERQRCQEQARDGIDDAQEHHVRAVRREVADTFGQDVFQIGQVDAADPRERASWVGFRRA